MSQYVFTLLLTSLTMSLLILAAAMLGEMFPRKFTARLRYAAWIIILAGLIIPIRPVVGGGLINIGLGSHISSEIVERYSPLGTWNIIRSSAQYYVARILSRISPIFIALLVWGTGALSVFAFHVYRYIRFIRLVNRWSVAITNETILSVFTNIKKEKGFEHRNIRLRRCNFISTSLLVGFLRPVVLLPEKQFYSDELEMIFRHEFIHYKRHDLFVKLAMMLAASIHWFNPAVYLMSAAMQADCEASCDEAVLAEVGWQNNQLYAELIIEMIGSKKKVGTSLSTCFYSSKRSIKKRMDAIMNTTKHVKKLSFVVLFAVVTFTVMSGSVFAFSEQKYTEQFAANGEIELCVTQSEQNITLAEAKEIALAAIGGGRVTETEIDIWRGQIVFEVEVLHHGREYEVLVSFTGEVLSIEID